MLVHFPTALFPFELICALVAFFTLDKSFAAASFFAMTGGVVLGFMAVVFGGMDLFQAAKENPKAINTVVWHGSINTCVIITYAVLAYLQFRNYPDLKIDGVAILGVKSGIVSLMFAANYLGGKLILKYGIAVEK